MAFQRLADVPPEIEWFANLGNKATRRAYENALQDFMRFTGIARSDEFRSVTRAHVIAWRDELVHRGLSSMTVRHRLAALSSLFEYLCERNTVTHNPVKGVKRPAVESYEGKTPALGDHQARQLLNAPEGVSVKGKRDRAILAALLYHALHRAELCKLKVKDFRHERRGVAHLKVSGVEMAGLICMSGCPVRQPLKPDAADRGLPSFRVPSGSAAPEWFRPSFAQPCAAHKASAGSARTAGWCRRNDPGAAPCRR